MKKVFCYLVFILLFMKMQAQQPQLPLQKTHTHWVDSVFNTLSLKEKIAQLIWVRAHSDKGVAHTDQVLQQIRRYKIGGLVFFQGNPTKQAQLTNFYQSQSRVPLLVAIDSEWGLGMRLKKTIKFPFQMSLGAVQNNDLIFQMGNEIARQLKQIGVHVNLAPVVDINTQPKNPVINYRSFGDDKKNVTQKALAYMNALQNNHILPAAKHFPGHGDTKTDSHLALPTISHSQKHIAENELYPYKILIKNGLSCIMSAHLNIPALDSAQNSVASLSEKILTNLLRKEMNFRGLIITDAMEMEGVARAYTPGKVDVKALKAGNDVLELVQSTPKAIEAIKKAVENGEIPLEQINRSCRRVLAAKQWVGLDKYQPVEIENFAAALNTPQAQVLNRQLTANSLTLLRNSDCFLPLQKLEKKRFASLSIGAEQKTAFQEMLENYTQISNFRLSAKATDREIRAVFEKLKAYDVVIGGIHGLWLTPQKRRHAVGAGIKNDENKLSPYGVTPAIKKAVQKLARSGKAAICVFANAYTLDYLATEQAQALIVAYEETQNTQELAAQLVFGAIGAKGRLPVTVNQHFKTGDGIDLKNAGRLAYAPPEAAGLNSQKLTQKIDSIVALGLEKKAFPGCVVLVAKKRKVVFRKAYGFHSYQKRCPTRTSDLFDFASVTKITGTLPVLMQLYDKGKFELDEKFSRYWTDWQKGLFHRSDKQDLVFRDVLAHQARLYPWIPFWRETVSEGKFKESAFRPDSTGKYNVRVAPNLWLNQNFRKKIYRAIRLSPLEEKKEYKYSGLSFFLYPKMIENWTGKDFESYVKENIYHPLGAYTITYNPLRFFPPQRVVPTENDRFFRKQPIHGEVHDEGAAMMGGVSGNAGLFGTADDLAKLMQMYMQMGEYGGRRYISEATLKEFTRRQFPENDNRRGLGFDKPLIGNQKLTLAEAYPAPSASEKSFGHSGFTGTFAWADPENELVYIFFSNRVFPTRENTKLYSLNIRIAIHQAIYDAFSAQSAK